MTNEELKDSISAKTVSAEESLPAEEAEIEAEINAVNKAMQDDEKVCFNVGACITASITLIAVIVVTIVVLLNR